MTSFFAPRIWELIIQHCIPGRGDEIIRFFRSPSFRELEQAADHHMSVLVADGFAKPGLFPGTVILPGCFCYAITASLCEDRLNDMLERDGMTLRRSRDAIREDAEFFILIFALMLEGLRRPLTWDDLDAQERGTMEKAYWATICSYPHGTAMIHPEYFPGPGMPLHPTLKCFVLFTRQDFVSLKWYRQVVIDKLSTLFYQPSL